MSKTLRTVSIRFFANNVGAQLSSSFEQSDSIPSFKTYFDCNTRSDPNFYFTPVDEDLVLTLITNLQNKTSSGIDNISNKLLKQIKHIIVQPLTLIINQSLTSGIYPDKFKISKITRCTRKMTELLYLTTDQYRCYLLCQK